MAGIVLEPEEISEAELYREWESGGTSSGLRAIKVMPADFNWDRSVEMLVDCLLVAVAVVDSGFFDGGAFHDIERSSPERFFCERVIRCVGPSEGRGAISFN